MQLALPISITLDLVLLTVFLAIAAGSRYAVADTFIRTRLVMTAFFCFIVVTLSLSFWPHAGETLPYTIPAFVLGALLGYVVGVREAERRIMAEGLSRYLQHFAHIHSEDLEQLRWWSLVNFYSVMGGLILINLVGLANVIYAGAPGWVIGASVAGAFLMGTIVPYLAHLWSIKAAHQATSTTSE